MVHKYKTTHRHHKALHGLSFSVEALTLTGIILSFMVHWILGLIAIIPMILLNGYLKLLLNALATLLYLRRDCGVHITWAEAYRYEGYFSPNRSGKWISTEFLRGLPPSARHSALLEAIARFDAVHGKPDGSAEPTLPKGTPIHPYRGEKHCPRGHGALREWEGALRCWTCGWPYS
jgi:hypothetical protein